MYVQALHVYSSLFGAICEENPLALDSVDPLTLRVGLVYGSTSAR
jgi:hypothetical protein